MSIETLNWLRDYAKQLTDEIAAAEDKKTDGVKEKLATLKVISAKLKEAIESLPTSREMTRDQASALKSAENALSEVSYAGRDFDETSSFTAKISQVYDIYIANDPDLEEVFTSKVKQRFKPSIYSRLKSSAESTKTWRDLQKWLNQTYDSGLSSIQLLTRAMETPFDSNTGWKKYSQNINDRMEPARHAILSQIRKSKMEKNPGSTINDAANDPKPEDVFDFFSASIIAGRLKVTKQDIHALMANEWASIADASTVATKIEFLQAQTNNQGGSVFFAQSKNKGGNGRRWNQNGGNKNKESAEEKEKKSKMPLCKFFQDGKCSKGNECRFRHEKSKKAKSKVHVAQSEEPTKLPEDFRTVFQ